MSDSTVDTEERRSPWTKRGYIASAVVVALIAVLAVVLLLTRPSKEDTAAPPPATTSTPSDSTTPTADDADASVCGLPAGAQDVPTSPPPGTAWELVGGVATPTAPEIHGPGNVNAGLRSCFAESPVGALYAAVNFVASASDPELRAQAVSELTAPGEGRDRAVAQVQGPQPSSGNRIQLVGFTFLNYSQDATTIDLAFRSGNGGLAHLPLSLQWVEGDWKVDLPASGEVFPGIGPIPDLTGYVPWGGA
ncbi:hypothetical protein [Vallicoccus soli]|uniref:DUF8175 domain-containing protein n=1 Tax=Vallicoccus soli TaxID=2339232 RepID=A0A3A3YU12_9ACTN|nr:hypothetical protein [Vallicoccus soli]RJK92540.1 hypothetical protein D5H78_18870 [Vallicoccus soli]